MLPYSNEFTNSTHRVETPGLDLRAEKLTKLYHFSDTSRLPWILHTGELRPGANKAGGFPDPEFVWATVDPLGDMTASVARGDEYMAGKVRHVRFTLAAAAFFPWHEVTARYPQWTPAHVERLRINTKGRSDPKTWWCCPRPIKVKDCLAVDTKSFRNKSGFRLIPRPSLFMRTKIRASSGLVLK